MTSLEAFVDVFIKYVHMNHRDHVALIFTYGSYARGKRTPTSDIDLAYITETGENDCLYNSFVYNGIGNEFWPISWTRLERIADAQDHYPVSAPMIAYSKILWSRSEKDLERFMALKEKIEEYRKLGKREYMVNKSLETYSEVYTNIAKLSIEKTLSGTRYLAIKTIIDCSEALGYANQTYFTSGWGSNHNEVLTLKHRPKNLEKYIDTIISSTSTTEIKTAAETLALETRRILVKLQRETMKPSGLRKHITDYYPGIKEYINKIKTATEKEDRIKTAIAAYTVQAELTHMLCHGETGASNPVFNIPSETKQEYLRYGFADLLENINTLSDKSDILDQTTQILFKKQGINLNKVENLTEFTKNMKKKC